MFEIKKSDLAGRIGILYTNHGKVETPAYVPVVHPVRQSIAPKKMREMGFDLVITNAYITLNNFREDAVRRGIHDIINYDGAVMTDSGGYQVLEYGRVDVEPAEMATFERNIQTDIAIPLDRPTGFGLSKKKAKSYVDHTLKISKETLDQSEKNGQIWVGPIQGGEHFDLVKRSTKTLVEDGFDMLALGSPVEFMESYEYKLLAEMILVAKKQMPDSIPLHLFGAGHPMTIPLAVALGCDTFDSASYMLYARKGRYIMDDLTIRLEEMSYFSCSCEVCSKYTPKELLAVEIDDRINKVALHNLFAIKAEVNRVKEAIHEGRLWEYVHKKARSHPKLFETASIFTENQRYFASRTPRFKEKAIFLFSKEDQFRPEVVLFHGFVRKFRSKKDILVIIPDGTVRPFYLSKEYNELKKRFEKTFERIQFCQFNPFLGIIPLEISDMYPASHYVMPRIRFNPDEFSEFTKTWNAFFVNNNFKTIYAAKDEFLKHHTKLLPKKIKVISITRK
jgi:7-cyano-7-deazaguanine tRNA-ribosyltransferase